MSKFIEINSATTTTLAIANNRNVNNATNRRTSNKVDVSKISITNSSAHADGAVVTVFLDGVELDRTVNQSNGTVTKIIFDEENFVSSINYIDVGYSVTDSDRTVHGTITVLNPDSNNTKEITISSSTTITDNEIFKIAPPNYNITGAVNIPAGITLVLDDPFNFNILNYSLKITNSGNSPSLTIRID